MGTRFHITLQIQGMITYNSRLASIFKFVQKKSSTTAILILHLLNETKVHKW